MRIWGPLGSVDFVDAPSLHADRVHQRRHERQRCAFFLAETTEASM